MSYKTPLGSGVKTISLNFVMKKFFGNDLCNVLIPGLLTEGVGQN